MVKIFIIMFFAVIFVALGDLLLSVGMKQIGEIHLKSLSETLVAVGKIVKNPWVLLGVLNLFVFFLLYLIALSLGDVSLIMPMTAASYVVVAILAKVFLNEEVSLIRLGGIVFVTLGVILISMSGKALSS